MPGIPWNSIDVERHYNNVGVDKKFNYAVRHLKYAALEHHEGSHKLYMTFLSWFNLFGLQEGTNVNQKVSQYFDKGLPGFLSTKTNEYPYYGIIVMSFPSLALVDKIIKYNRFSDLIGQPVVTLRNTYYNEYLYASSSTNSDDHSRRAIFTWNDDTTIRYPEEIWKLTIMPQNSSNDYIALQNPHYNNEFLYASSIKQDSKRRQVFTWAKTPGRNVAEGLWEEKTVGNSQ